MYYYGLQSILDSDLDLWPWLSIEGELGSWPIYAPTKTRVQRSVGSKGRRCRKETHWQTSPTALPSQLTRWALITVRHIYKPPYSGKTVSLCILVSSMNQSSCFYFSVLSHFRAVISVIVIAFLSLEHISLLVFTLILFLRFASAIKWLIVYDILRQLIYSRIRIRTSQSYKRHIWPRSWMTSINRS